MRVPVHSFALSLLALAACLEPDAQSPDSGTDPVELRQDLGPEFEATILRYRQLLWDATQADIDTVDEGYGMGGVTVAVGIGGEIVWTESYGWSDFEADRRADEHTRYRLASLTKTITTAVFLQQVEEGRVDLDDAVADLVPEILTLESEAPETITWRHALTHTAGFDHHNDSDWAARLGPANSWDARFLQSLDGLGLSSAPGQAYTYSNAGMALAGIASARLEDTTYEQVLTTRALEPLQLEETGLNLQGEAGAAYARGYDRRVDPTRPSLEDFEDERVAPEYTVPATRLHSSAAELTRIAAALDPEVGWLSEEAYALLTEPLHEPYPDAAPSWYYGMGVWNYAVPDDGSPVLSHPGDWAGTDAAFYVHPETNLTVVLLRNYNYSSLDRHTFAWGLMEELIEVIKEGSTDT